MGNGVQKGMNDKIIAIVLAAGQGKRMNAQVAKQFLELKNKPVLYYSLKAFEESSVDEIILVCGRDQIDYCKDNIIDPYGFTKVRQIIEGGKERYDSVYKSLRVIGQADYVLIHDGARPFIFTSMINKVIRIVRESKACIVASPVKDTIKIADKEGKVKETPSRNLLWSAQTPQAFEYNSIKQAYEILYTWDEEERKSFTDDSMVYEMIIKKPVSIVVGDNNNIKLTTREDFALARILIDELL